MKRIVVAFAALLIAAIATPLSAAERAPSVVDEVIRMWKANVAEDAIIAYVQKSDARFNVSADDVIDMSEAKVPRTVIKAVLDEADDRGDRSRSSDRRETVYAPRVTVSPYWYGYDPYYYYDPFWYRPRVSIGFNFGYGRYYGGHHFRRHR